MVCGAAGGLGGEDCGVEVELLVAEPGWAAGAGVVVCCAAIATPDSASVSHVTTAARRLVLMAASSFPRPLWEWQEHCRQRFDAQDWWRKGRFLCCRGIR